MAALKRHPGELRRLLIALQTKRNLSNLDAAVFLDLSKRHVERIRSGWEPSDEGTYLQLRQKLTKTTAPDVSESPLHGVRIDELTGPIARLAVERAKLVTLIARCHTRIATIDVELQRHIGPRKGDDTP